MHSLKLNSSQTEKSQAEKPTGWKAYRLKSLQTEKSQAEKPQDENH